MQSGSRGVVLVVWGKRGYGFAAYNLAVSLKYHSPAIPITLIATQEVMNQVPDRSVFDDIIWTDEIVSDPGRFKARLYDKLPYEYNLYLDVDAFTLRPIDSLFDRLINDGGHYYTFINDVYDKDSPNLLPQMFWAWKDDIWAHYQLTDHKLPASQSSIQFIKKCEESKQLFELIEKCFDNPIPLDKLRNQWGGTQPDELYLNIALALQGKAPHIGNEVIWFGNNASKKVRELVSSYYFLSYFGWKGNIKTQFWDYYDAALIKMCASRGHRHCFKQQFIKADKHANNKMGLVVKRNAPPTPAIPQVRELLPGTIYLFTSYFQSGDARRDVELRQVMETNIACQSITRIYNLGTDYDHPKVINVPHERPTYKQFVDCVNANPGDYNIIANSDIYFTSEVEAIKTIDFHNTCLALSRYDIKGRGNKLLNYEHSQDTWIFKGSIKPVNNIDFIQGRRGCDNRFAYELTQAGYRVINPSFDIKTYHLHQVNRRTHGERDRIHGNYLPVKCEKADQYQIKRLLIHQPGKVGDILIVLPIAKYYSDQGFRVEWLCPEQYHDMFAYVDYVKPVTLKHGTYFKEIDLSFGIIQNTQLHVWWLKNKKSFASFVNVKYHLAGVPITERHNLQYTRNLQKEQELFDKISTENYALVHDRSDYGSVPEIETSLPIIKFAPVEGYSIFDWRLVIEQAVEIHCIDSSLANFVEVIETTAARYFYRVPERVTESLFDFNKWELKEMVTA